MVRCYVAYNKLIEASRFNVWDKSCDLPTASWKILVMSDKIKMRPNLRFHSPKIVRNLYHD